MKKKNYYIPLMETLEINPMRFLMISNPAEDEPDAGWGAAPKRRGRVF